MGEYSKPFSKDIAFMGDYPSGEDYKLIRVGTQVYSYPEASEDEDSALPKKDIEALINEKITDQIAGVNGSVALVSDVAIIEGAIKKKTRTLTIEKGVIIAVSNESIWS